MQRTMRAAVVRDFGQPLAIEEVPIPAPSAGQVLVQIVASGVCHTDLHAANGDWPVKPTCPFIPGHEGVGYVAALGPGVVALKEGDRVGVPWFHGACGSCDHCITGWETLCPSQQNTGYSVNGGYAEYVVAPAAYVGHIPNELDFFEAAPLLCAGVTTYKGLKETEARPGQWVVVSGIGGLGHLAIQYANAMGLRVVAVDVGAEKLALARSLDAEVAIDALHVDPAVEVQRLIGGAHGALVTAVSPGAFRQAIGTLRSGGTCVFVGLPPGDFPTPIFEVVLKRLTLRGSIVGTRMDLKEALEMAARTGIKPTIELAPLDEINGVFARMRDGEINGRVVLAIRDR
jgi:alcohol dehydrogenase, propanol-preferring